MSLVKKIQTNYPCRKQDILGVVFKFKTIFCLVFCLVFLVFFVLAAKEISLFNKTLCCQNQKKHPPRIPSKTRIKNTAAH